MTSPTLRGTVIPRAVIFCASAAAVLSVAACSSGGTVAGTAVDAASASGAKTAANGSGSDSGSGASSDDTTTAAATADPSTLLLTTADVPAGFQVTPAEANKAGSDMSPNWESLPRSRRRAADRRACRAPPMRMRRSSAGSPPTG
ncbi:hypothetical protein GCM10027169_25850 [Gordonia jinhuaensis]|uniref:Uncharacterized protein n=1 Tax=Gordonia jinhuaensis TaxID=1517702 RepID=A0A916WWX7_9ACTN|nr:hypothetical protein [Gordonia jinhuaensis]GGB38889.1 hypothetical protein GCM10011489_28260 [Gordonia jinhuaensis]